MNTKKLFISFLSCAIIAVSVSVAHAQTTSTTANSATPITRPTKTPRSSENANMRKELATQVATTVKERAIAEIDRRVTALTELITKINNLKHLTDTEKAALSAQVQSEITSLSALRTKIEENTDPTTLKADIQSIVLSHRIFALFIPQIRLLAAAESLDIAADKMLDLVKKFEVRIAELQAAGQDVARIQTMVANMQAKITDAKAQSNAITAAVSPLTPTGFPGNKTTLTSSRQKLQSGIQQLKSAGQDARQIMKLLKELSGVKLEATATPAAAVN